MDSTAHDSLARRAPSEIIEGLVSISIPFLNGERFLRDAVESVLTQSYPHWELLLVDDGSTDGSAAIAREYAARMPDKIRYLEHPGHRNCGLTSSRNLGARHSRGEFLAFLDSDDAWLPEKLAEQVRLMRAHPEVGMVYGRSEWWYDWDPQREPKLENEIFPMAPGERVYRPSYLLTACYPLGPLGAPPPSSLLLRRSAFDRVGGFEEDFNSSTHQLFEDQAFLAKVYLNLPVFVSEKCLDRYRNHPGSMSSQIYGTPKEALERAFYFRWLRNYLLSNRIFDPGIWWTVMRRSWQHWMPQWFVRLMRSARSQSRD